MKLALFLHILGAMTLFGTTIAALVLASTRRAAATFTALLVAIPSYIVLRVFAEITRSKGHFSDKAGWIELGRFAADGGLVLLLATIGVAFWWKRSGTPVAGRIAAVLSAVYLLLLTVAMLAMSGKWG